MVNLLAILEDDEGRHGRDFLGLGNFTNSINVNLEEVNVGFGVLVGGPLFDHRSDGLTWTTPGGVEVNDLDFTVLGLQDLGFEFSRSVDRGDSHFGYVIVVDSVDFLDGSNSVSEH